MSKPTSSGIAVIGRRRASTAPTSAPTATTPATAGSPAVEVVKATAPVTATATSIPRIPRALPALAVSGFAKPLIETMKSTADAR